MKPGIYELPARVYHSDPCEKPSLSASIAHTLVSRSPLHAWLQHPRLGKQPREATPEMDRGTRIHAMVLGQPLEVSVIHADNYRTKAAQEQRDAARGMGLVPVLARELDEDREVAACITRQLASQGVALVGRREAVVVWEESSLCGPVMCRGMMDHFAPPIIDDLKTCRDANPESLARHVVSYGYHVQAAAYLSAVQTIYPDLAGRVRFRWIFAEILPEGGPESAPRAVVTVASPSGAMLELGQVQWRRAVETWAKCISEDRWPGYATCEAPLDPPTWSLRELVEVQS